MYLNDLEVDEYFRWSGSVSGKIGYCCQENLCDSDATVKDQLALYACISGVSRKYVEEEADRFIKIFELENYRDTKCGLLSFGNKRKLNIAMAFIGNNELVILDDPLAGVDPLSHKTLQKSIKSVSKNKAVIISTQDPSVATALSTKSAILHKGHIVRFGSLEKIIEEAGGAGIFVACYYDMPKLHAIDQDY